MGNIGSRPEHVPDRSSSIDSIDSNSGRGSTDRSKKPKKPSDIIPSYMRELYGIKDDKNVRDVSGTTESQMSLGSDQRRNSLGSNLDITIDNSASCAGDNDDITHKKNVSFKRIEINKERSRSQKVTNWSKHLFGDGDRLARVKKIASSFNANLGNSEEKLNTTDYLQQELRVRFEKDVKDLRDSFETSSESALDDGSSHWDREGDTRDLDDLNTELAHMNTNMGNWHDIVRIANEAEKGEIWKNAKEDTKERFKTEEKLKNYIKGQFENATTYYQGYLESYESNGWQRSDIEQRNRFHHICDDIRDLCLDGKGSPTDSHDGAASIADRLKLLQDLPHYQSDQTVGSSSPLTGYIRENFRHIEREHRAFRRNEVSQKIQIEGKKLAQLLTSSDGHVDHPMKEDFVEDIHNLLKEAVKESELASTDYDQKGGKNPSKLKEDALTRIKEIADELQKCRAYLELWNKFERLGGNATRNLKVIGVGQHHYDRAQHKEYARMIESIARYRKVIVLVEEEETGKKVGIERDTVTRKISKDIRKNVTVFGWDDKALRNRADSIDGRLGELNKQLEKEENLQKKEEINLSIKKYKNMWLDTVVAKRNKKLLESLNNIIDEDSSMATSSHDHRILNKEPHDDDSNTVFVVIAGRNHFTEDLALIQNLEKYKYIILNSEHKVSYEEMAIEQARQLEELIGSEAFEEY